MKISTMDFDPNQEPLLAIVVSDCRKKGILPSAIKTALINDRIIQAVWANPNSTKQERLDAIALTQAGINAQQRLIDICLHSVNGEAPAIACHSAPEVKQVSAVAAIVPDNDGDDDEILDTY
jgi:hypothetical protein